MADEMDPRETQQKGRTNEEGMVDREDAELDEVDEIEEEDEEEDLEA